MCGIFFHCSNKSESCDCTDPKLIEFLGRRGPDALHQINCFQFDYCFKFIGNVLHLRGGELVRQPINDNLNILLWNGEMYNCDFANEDQSDSQFIFNQFEMCNGDLQSIYSVISKVEGPFSFIYYNEQCKSLFFGRDAIGRRSLCWKKVDEPFQLIISSVCSPEDDDWEEIPANGIYCCDFSYEKPKLKLIQWERNVAGTLNGLGIESIPSPINTAFNEQLPEADFVESYDENDETVNTLISILSKSIETRVTKFNQLCQRCVDNCVKKCDHSSVGILFSGGLDSSTLALLSDNYIPGNQSIDLINVAFSPDAPDRLTGLESYEEIKTIRPERRWNFIQINVSLEDLQKARHSHIRHLIKPADTVLDDSVACAVWFAAKGHGICGTDEEYYSPARIVLLGMGADEQFAGYSRHRSAFRRSGWEGLINEVRNDLTRIWTRNLGRDDRIVSDHGRESRLPYLDENLINFLNSLPIWKKANLTLERGKGDKILLRFVALKLGLTKASGFPKRAIQFGCRIAHLEKRGEKGSDQCPRLS